MPKQKQDICKRVNMQNIIKALNMHNHVFLRLQKPATKNHQNPVCFKRKSQMIDLKNVQEAAGQQVLLGSLA